MSDIKASEVIGELRKAARLYKVFEKAEEMAQILADQEEIFRNLKKQIADAEVVREQTYENIDKEVEKAEKALDAVDAEVALKKQEVADLKAEAAKIDRATKEKAQAKAAEFDALSLKFQADISNLMDAKAKATLEKEAAEGALKAAKEAHKKFVESLGG
jgi:hypothetical protein